MQKSDTGKVPAFIADCHLGKLAKYLRLMGFDTLYFPQIDDNDLIDLVNKECRIILTRDKELYERQMAQCILLKAVGMETQLREVVKIFHLKKYQHHFSRCIVCNEPLAEIDKESILHRLPPKVLKYFFYFEICKKCDRIYWHGDHYKHMKAFLEKVLVSA